MYDCAKLGAAMTPFERAGDPHGQPMIESIQIRNFRSFSDTLITGCGRVNVIVGDNGSGKTSLLEAVVLAAGPSPEMALRSRAWRGLGSQSLQGSPAEIEKALWADLFHNFDLSKTAFVGLKGSEEHSRSVTVTYQQVTSTYVPASPGKRVHKETIFHERPLLFEWKGPKEFEKEVRPYWEDGALKIPPVPDIRIHSAFFAANHTYAAFEAVNNFSALSREFKAKEFVERFKHFFQGIKDVSIEVSAGQPLLFAEKDDLPAKIPLSLASSGMAKLAAILLGISSHPGGVVIIDEIESGFYYRILPKVWESILALAQHYDVQVFASTHSLECLRAAAQVAKGDVKSFGLMRTVLEGGTTKVRNIPAARFVAAMDEDIELR